jgi:TPR repeat protein
MLLHTASCCSCNAASNHTEAVRNYSVSAAQGQVDAQFMLARVYEGYKGAANFAEALRLYRAAAEQGYAGAAQSLGRLLA